jgi:hypothetical protein
MEKQLFIVIVLFLQSYIFAFINILPVRIVSVLTLVFNEQANYSGHLSVRSI